MEIRIENLLDMEEHLKGKSGEINFPMQAPLLREIVRLAIVGMFGLNLDVVRASLPRLRKNESDEVFAILTLEEQREMLADAIVRKTQRLRRAPDLPKGEWGEDDNG